jgi:hypothetical protein
MGIRCAVVFSFSFKPSKYPKTVSVNGCYSVAFVWTMLPSKSLFFWTLKFFFGLVKIFTISFASLAACTKCFAKFQLTVNLDLICIASTCLTNPFSESYMIS